MLPKSNDIVVEETNEELGSKPLCETLQDLSLRDEEQKTTATNDTGTVI